MQPARSATPVQNPVRESPALRLSVATTATATCGCGHAKPAHEHYRRGTDCAFCDCARYRRPLLRRLGLLAR
ncbi:hypothetical protein [Geodermatophilus normandii]|uniref:Uncharacterized protein n=1 Tax=Geodermatophilus normandii TaxID=1137989 RepID=A0A6P0GFE5_9ACTN|nr:hypothetical protein [Geodermatophilus normandii]NEM05962.1 hypothetical protein [Geodermatophilus normandii]